MKQTSVLDEVMEGLMRRYRERVPDVTGIVSALEEESAVRNIGDIENDHIAFRTMGVPQLGIKSFEKIFIHLGYEKRDFYSFDSKKLNAYWYSPPTERHPRIFVSELRVGDLSPEAQRIIASYTDQVKSDPVDSLDLDDPVQIDLFLHSPLWSTPTLSDYLRLLEESEYAAWVIYNRYYLNHFTISVHNLPEEYNTVVKFNEFLTRHGFKINDAGGKIKTSPDGGLIQSATVAQTLEATFANGEKHVISGSYVEFAERKVLPQFATLPPSEIKRIHRRDGFEASNADKIFESTYTSQTKR